MADTHPPNTEHYPARIYNPPAIELKLSSEGLKKVRGENPLEKLIAQGNQRDTTSNTNGPCIVKYQSVNNCVDIIYQRAQSADEIYQGAKVTPRNTQYATRYKFLDAEGKEWIRYFFESGEISKKTQEIFRDDPLVNFEALYRLHLQYRGKIEKVGLFREGFMVIGISDSRMGGLIIPISPETVDKLATL